MDELSFDTTFLIDFHKERKQPGKGPAHRFAEANIEAVFCLSCVALGEFAAGFAEPDDPVLRESHHSFRVLSVDAETAFTYRRLFRHLKDKGLLIGANDLWIAACSLRWGLPLVTRNVSEFQRAPGLEVIGY